MSSPSADGKHTAYIFALASSGFPVVYSDFWAYLKYTPSIHLSKAYLHLTERPRKKIKSLSSLISGELCERNLLLAQMPKRRFSVFQCKNTNGPYINGIFRFQNRPLINRWRE
jgi:hypothetical protein